MRSFLISIAVFLCVTVSVFCSSAYVRRTCGEILAEAQQTDADSDLSSLVSRWEKERVRFRAIVGHTEVDPADEALADMESWVSSGSDDDSADSAEFEAAKARFLAAVEGVRACEIFSFDSIF